MKEQRSSSIGSYRRPALLLVFAVLAMAPGLSLAALSLDFATPADNGSYGADFVGTFTYGPVGPIAVVVTNGVGIVPPGNVDVDYGSGSGSITLTPVFGQTGRVDVLVDRNSGGDQVSFTVNFRGPSASMTLTPDFTSPATNSSPGAAFANTFSFTPVNESARFNVVITSGSSIVPAANITLTTNFAGGTVNITMTPAANTSGVVQARMSATNGFTGDSSAFEVVFRTYPPQISNIDNKIMPEDGTTNIAFTVADPDTAPAGIVLTRSSSNTNLIDSAGMIFGGSGTNRTITLTPKANINGSATITVWASDGANTNSDSFTLTVSPVADWPVVSGMTNVQAASPGPSFDVLPTIVVSDVDDNMPTVATQTVTVTLSPSTLARFPSGLQTFVTTGTPAAVSTVLQDLQAIPQAGGGVPGSVNNLTVAVSVYDGSFTVNTNSLAVITVVNMPPSVQVSLSPTNIVEGESVQPFRLNYLTDPDLGDTAFILVIGITNAYEASLGTITPTNRLVGNATTIGSQLSQLFFNSLPGVMTSAIAGVNFTFEAFDSYGTSSVFEAGMQISQMQSPPAISGIPVETRIINDTPAGTTLYPLAFVNDPDEGGNQLVRASLSVSPALGTFTTNNTPLLTQAGLITLLRAVKFIPTPGLVPVGAESNAVMTLTVTDATGLTVQNDNLTIRIRGINNAPQFPNFPEASEQPVLIPPAAPIHPFKDIRLTSDDTNTVSFSLSIDAAGKGSLSNLGSFVRSGSTTYLMSGSVTSILSSLTNITYQLNPAYTFPPSDPGGTVFTLSARDYALLTKTVTLYIQVQAEPRHHLVTRAFNDGLPGSFTYALSMAGNNDFITFALPSYPAVIRMPGTAGTPLVRNVTIKGPGANLLTISGDNNGDNTPDRQIFQVSSAVTIEGITLACGIANYGGAVQVLSNGVLTLRNAGVVDSVAVYYGGGIDVTDGALVLDGVFIGRNRVSTGTGSGGGGVSAYTAEDLVIRNSTFSGNQQANGSGDGGGAMILENSRPGAPMYVNIEHTTFAENTDAAGRASAVLCVNEDAIVRPSSTVFSDESGRNLDVAGNGAFDSQGANFSDDSTQTSFTQGGEPGSVVLLDHVTDRVSTDAWLSPLSLSGDPTPHYQLLAGSPAINHAIGSSSAADQRGVLRTDVPDSGSCEYNASGRLVINEIHATGAVHFVELYVRRDSTPVDLADYALFVGDTAVHSFRTNLSIGTNDLFSAGATNSSIIRPGFGMVIAFTTNPVSLTANGNPNPVIRPSLLPTNGLPGQSVISVGLSAGSPFARQSYLMRYLSPVSGTNLLDVLEESIALAPQFRGHALIPHSFVRSGPFEGGDTAQALGTDPESPAADADGTAFGLANAYPVALSDLFTVTEDDLGSLDVLGNDFDGDGNDRVVVVDVSTSSGGGSGDAATAASVRGAMISIDPTNQPLRGMAVLFDPRAASALQQLPVGTETIDDFFYEGIDIGAAAILSQAAGPDDTVVFGSTNHRLTNGQHIVISGSSQSNYNGTFRVLVLGEDTFAVSNSFFSGVAQLGGWQTVMPRSPTARTEASVTVRVLGVNDAPVAGADVVTGITERTVARVMIRPELAGTAITFPTDPLPAPLMLATNLVYNDDDVDADDDWSNLRIVGVMGSVNAVSGYSGISGATPVTVSAPAHGLTSGDTILLANYGGHPSYNGYSVVTVVDADTFTMPRVFVDDDSDKGVWVRAADSAATTNTSSMGAGVSLLLRADVTEDHLIYDASVSAYLQGLSQNERCTNRVYYTVRDRHGASGIGWADFVVTGVNNAPVAQPDPGSVDVLNPLVSSSNSLSAVLGSGLDYMYSLPPSSGASNRLDVHALDVSGTLPGTIMLEDLFFTDEDTAIAIPASELLVNDSDIDRTNTLSVVSVDGTSREGVSLSLASGLIQYNPAPVTNLQALMRGEIVVDSFSVIVSDGAAGGNVTSLVTVAVLGVNDTPVAGDVTLNTQEDENLRFDPRTSVVERDINGIPPDDRLTLVPATNVPNPGQAPVTISTTGVLHEAAMSYLLSELNAGDVFTNTFSYTVRDDSFLLAMDDQFEVLYDRGTYTLPVLVNDRDYISSSGVLTVVSVGPTAAEGSATINSNGSAILYDPPFSTYTGEDHFRYIIRNADGVESRARVTVRLIHPPVNGILFAADDQFAVARGETITMPVLANDGNTPGAGGLVITRIVSTSLANQPVLVNNQFVYDASSGPSQLTFTYEMSAGGDSLAQADVQLDVYDRSGALRIQDDTFHVLAGSLSNQLPVLLNDGLLGESAGHYRIRSIPLSASHGSLTTNATGTALVYTPDDGFIGTEQVRYLVADGLGATGSGAVSIVVGQIEAARDFYTVAASTNLPSVSLDVLENDRMLALPRGSLRIVSVAPASSSIGTNAVGPGGSNLVFSASGSSGESTFSYVVEDESTPARSATGIVTVAAVPSGAYANPDRYIVRGNGSDYELDVLANDISYPADGKVYSIAGIAEGPDQGGSVEIQDGKLVYTPAEGFFGEESLTYTLSDSVTMDDAIVTVSVRRGDMAAARDRFAVYYEYEPGTNIARSFDLPVLDNDGILPPLDQTLTVVSIGAGSQAPDLGGSAAVGGGQSVTYRPLNPPADEYIETFTYEVDDGAGRQASALVEVRVLNRASNLVAVTHDDEYAVARNSTNNTLQVLSNDGIRPSTVASWTITSVSASSAGASITIHSGALRYTPPANFVGLDTFTYSVSDGLGGTGNATVEVRVGALPTVDDDFVALSDSISNRLDVVANDPQSSDVASEYVLFSASGADQGGSLALFSNRVMYTPASSFTGIERFTYVIRDDGGMSWSGAVRVLVLDKGSDRDTATITMLVAGLGGSNAVPAAQTDEFAVTEDWPSQLNVLLNDLDDDAGDVLWVADLSTGTGEGGDDAQAYSEFGALVSVDPLATNLAATPPVQARGVTYNPLAATNVQALPLGGMLTDTFHYEVVDVGSGAITGYAAGASVVLYSPGHRLTNGTVVTVSGSSVTNYNVEAVVSVVDASSFRLAGVPFAGDAEPRGTWIMRDGRIPSARSEAIVRLTVIGENDPPVPVMDVIPDVTEDTVTRILAMPDLVGSTTAEFDTDYDYPMVPVISAMSLLPNDTDPDSDDEGVSLHVVGVVSEPRAVVGYAGTTGAPTVTVTATAHGLESGDTVLISGYGGYVSYNGLHEVTVVDADTFTIPVLYFDDHAVKGVWARLEDDNRLTAMSMLGATLDLEIRADPRETSIVYNPRVSSNLNGVAAGQTVLDSFYYVAQDRHGAASLGFVSIPVAGVNDGPVDVYDPEDGLNPLVALAGGTPLADFLQTVPVDYTLPSALGTTGRMDVSVVVTGAVSPYNLLLPDFWVTDEHTELAIAQGEVLANASDVDTNDVLAVAWVSPLSKLGASVSIDAGTGDLIYSPSNSVRLNALARGELIFDSFEVAVSDFAVTDPGTVTSLLAVVVRGINDTPITSNDWFYITENEAIVGAPVLTNDIEFDIDGACPDDSLFILDETNSETVVTHVSSNVPVPFSIRNSTFTFDPGSRLDGLVEGWVATARVDYTAFDGSMFFAVDDQFVVEKGAAGVVLNVTANDRDYTPRSEGFWIAKVGNTSRSGTVVNLSGTNLLYSPATNYVGDEFFTYTLTNLHGVCTRGLVQVRVVDDKLNGMLYPMRDHFAVALGETVTVSLVANDYFLPESGLDLEVAAILSAPDHGGSVAIGAGGTVTYAPADVGPGAYPYVESFNYMVGDGGIARGTSTVEILVVNRRGSLDVSDDAYSVESGSEGNALAVLANDGFLPVGCPTWRLISATPSPRAAISADGRSIVYSPLPGFVGLDTLEYVVTDGLGGTGTGVVQVAVGDVVILADAYTVLTNTVETLDVLGNDRVLAQAQPGNLVITGIDPASVAQGSMSIAGGSALQFTASGVTGTVVFAYTVTTSGGTMETGSVTVMVIDRDAVVASPDRFRVLRDSTTNALNVLVNDVRFPTAGGTLVIQSIGTGVNAPDKGGTVAIGAGGTTLLYTPAPGFSGTEAFTYTVTNSAGESTASVVVEVDGGRIRANADKYTVLFEDDGMGAASTQYVLPVAVNDRMLPYYGQSLTIIAVGLDAAATNAPDRMGGVEISPDGQSLIYTPTNIGLVAEYVERFTYEITDGTYRRAYANVAIIVQTREDAADLGTVDDTFAVRSNTESNELPVLANDGIRPATVAGWSITAITADPTHGVAALHGGQVFYTPDEDFVGWDSLDYSVTDGKGGSGEATARIWVGELPGTPDTFAVVSGSQSNRFDVLANDGILGRDIVALDLLDAGWTSSGGTAAVLGGQVVYTPDAGYAGSYPYIETLEYRLQDQTGGHVTGHVSVVVYEALSDCDTSTITIVVTGVNDVPTLTGIQTNLSMTDVQTVNPFGTVVIEDVDEWRQQPLNVLVRLNDPTQGAFSNLSGFLPIAYGLYRYIGPGDNVSTAIQALVYHHAPYRLAVDAQENVRFTVSVSDGFIPTPIVDSSTVVRVTGTMFNEFAPNHLLQANGGRLLQWSSANSHWPTLLNLNDGTRAPTNVGQAWVSEEWPVLPQELIFGFKDGMTVPLQALVIYNYGEGSLNRYSKGYEIWSSFDGTNYVKVRTGELLPNVNAQRIHLGSILCKKLRVLITSAYNSQYVELAEIEAYGQSMELFWFDEDGDGQYSAYETTHGFDWTDPSDGDEDIDGDGLSNAAEAQSGTNPEDPDDLLLVFFVRDANGVVKPAFLSVQDHRYTVEYLSPQDDPSDWVALPGYSGVYGDGSVVVIDDAEATSVRYYRVRSTMSEAP